MAESTQTASLRQIKLEKQKLRLEQKRGTRHLQNDKVTINRVGSRPGTGKSSRPNTGKNSRPSSNNSRPSSGNNSRPSSDTNSLPSTDAMIDSEPSVRVGDNEMIDYDEPPEEQKTNGTEVAPLDNGIDVSQKLLELGISSTVAYDSDDSSDSNIEASKVHNDHPISLDEQESHPLEKEEVAVPIVPAVTSSSVPVSDEMRRQLPNEHFEPPSDKTDLNPLNAVVADRTITNLKEVVFKPPPEGVTVHCRIIRTKLGVDKYIHPTYTLEVEWDRHTNMFLLAAKIKKKSRSSYYTISTDPSDVSRDSPGFVAKLRSNFVGTSFVAYDAGRKHGLFSPPSSPVDNVREELVAVNYDTNILGFKGPRRMNVFIPSLSKSGQRIHIKPTRSSETLLERVKYQEMSNVLQLYNKQPVWSEETQAYVLNFRGRVTEASVKNFQLIHSSSEDYVIVQFGRVSEDVFTMDYSFPICAVQAFAVCLSSFDRKLACE